MTPRLRVALLAGIALVLSGTAGCSEVTSGSGHETAAPGGGSATPSFPSTAESSQPSVEPTTPATPTAPTAPATTALPSQAILDARLTAATNGEPHCLLRLATSGEAAVYDQVGHIELWHYISAWRQLATSTYPYDQTGVGAPAVSVRCTVLTGMSVGTYIADGNFSGDGSGNAIAYTTGRPGWGAVKAEPNGDIGPSGQGVTFGGLGLADEFDFVNGRLETADCSATVPISACGGTERVLKLWAWSGTDFRLVATGGLPR